MSKPVISIIELHYHAEVLQNLFELLDFEQFNFQLIVSESVAKHISVPKELPVFEVKKSIREVEEQLLASDLLLFNTLADGFDDLRPYFEQKPTVVRIHNVNTWFGKQGMAKPRNLYEAWKFSSHFIRKELFGHLGRKRQQAIQHIDQFIFPAEFMVRQALSLRPALEKKIYERSIPLASQKEIFQVENQKKHIVIPGRVDQRKKDYEFALDVCKELASNENYFLLTLLGNPAGDYGQKVIEEFQKLNGSQVEVVTYGQYIPPNQFWQTIQQADVLFLPLVRETSFTMYREYYGQTKISGAVNDALAYGKPFLIPNFYPIEKELANQAIQYTSLHEAVGQLESILREEQPIFLEQTLTKEVIQEMYTHLFREVLNL